MAQSGLISLDGVDVSTPMRAARSFQPRLRGRTGLLRVNGFKAGPHIFVVALSGVGRYTYHRLLQSEWVNGLCPWCGAFSSLPLLQRTIAPHPQAGQTIAMTRWKGEAIVADFGLTAACPVCQDNDGRRELTNVASQVDEAPWNGIPKPGSKLNRQFRMIPPRFRWETGFPAYMTLDVRGVMFADRASWWGMPA